MRHLRHVVNQRLISVFHSDTWSDEYPERQYPYRSRPPWEKSRFTTNAPPSMDWVKSIAGWMTTVSHSIYRGCFLITDARFSVPIVKGKKRLDGYWIHGISIIV
jgi:hypothetical protein